MAERKGEEFREDLRSPGARSAQVLIPHHVNDIPGTRRLVSAARRRRHA